MTSTDDVAGLCAGPCVICGGTNYNLSCGGPTICPKCDCGQFDAATVLQQAKVIAGLRSDLESQANALREMDPQWARGLRDGARRLDRKFFMKQMTGKKPIPDDLMIRQFPTPAGTGS